MYKRLSFFIFSILLGLNVLAQDPLQVSFESDGDPTPGQLYEVDVRVSDFNQLLGAQFAVKWDSLVLEIDTISFITSDLPDFNAGVFGGLPGQSSNSVKGELKVSWFNFSPDPQTLPNNHLLFTMGFNVVGSACDTTSVSLTSLQNFDIEILNNNLENIGAVSTPLPVMIPGTGCGGGGGGGNDDAVQLIFPDILAQPGETVCMPFTTMNFDTVESFQGSLMWDPNVLQFSEIQNFGLPGLNAANFNTNNTSNGSATFVWFDATGVTPITLDSDDIVFEVCFDVIGSIGEMSAVKLANMPAVIEISSPSPIGKRDFEIVEGSVIIADDVEPGATFSIVADTVNVDMSAGEVCVDFSTLNFDNIAAMQYTLQWDATVLTYNRVEAVDPEFANTFNPAGMDRLRYSWNHSQATGLDVSDGTVIYRVCFDIIGDCDSSTALEFVSEPGRPIEISDGTFNPLPANEVNLQNGLVNVICSILLEATVNDVRCNEESNGSINLMISGGQSPYDVEWEWSDGDRSSPGVTSGDLLVGQGADTYCVTVTDSNGETATACYDIMQPDPIEITVDVMGNMIDVSATGGNGNYTFEYSPVIDPTMEVPDGTYTVLVTDSRGCSETQIFVVGAECSNPVTVNTVVFAASCGDDGQIEVNCTGGSGNFTITSDPALSLQGNTFVDVPAGTYTITCQDNEEAGCTESVEIQVLTENPDPIVLSVSNVQDVSCTGELGSFDVSATGGCEPYIFTYSLNGATPVIYDPNGQYAEGEYEIFVTGANGSSDSETITISVDTGADLMLEVDVEPAPCTGMMGEVTFTLSGNCGDLSCELLVNGNNAQDCNLTDNGDGTFTGMYPIGTHEIVFTDDFMGEMVSSTFTVSVSPNALTANVSSFSLNGIDLNVTGGVPPYQFFWMDPNGESIGDIDTEDLTASDISGPGMYSVTIVDVMGCSIGLTVNIPGDGELSINVDPVSTPFDGFASPCAEGDCMGVITGVVVNGVAPYSLVAEGVNSGNIIEVTLNEEGEYEILGLCPDVYNVSVEDNDGSMVVAPGSFVITAPDPIVIEEDQSSCPDEGQNNGFISASVSGGTGLGYIYSWNPASGDPIPGPTNENLGPGTYTLFVEDSNGCEAQLTFDLVTDCIDTECFIGRRVITPNNDGSNDVLSISCANGAGYRIEIFDRWAELVFTTGNYTNNWAGTNMAGEELPEGAYFWVLSNGDSVYQGTVTLLRD